MWIYDGKLRLLLAENEGKLCGLKFVPQRKTNVVGKVEFTPLMAEVCQQLDEYFSGKRREFEIPLVLKGTDFQLKVWEALRRIPYGKTVTYKDIASDVGNPKAVRAVGMANHYNPIAIIVPCHRVVGVNGKLVGYAGGLDIKRYLLDLENKNR